MIELCSEHSQRRSLYFGKGLFYWVGPDEKEHPLCPDTTTIAATKEGYAEAYSSGKIKKNCTPASLSHANIQTIQEAFMPPEATALVVKFSLTIKAHSGQLHRCNSSEMEAAIRRLADTYQKVGGYRELARRYLENLLLGVWLWENQDSLETEICLTDYKSKDQLVVENVQERRWNKDLSDLEVSLKAWIDRFEKALTSRKDKCSILVEAKLILPLCAEVWPSQAFQESDKSKVLATCNLDGESQVVFTRHKIGAAIHEVDDWFPGADKRLRVSAYGADRENVTAHRHPDTKKDFYSLIKKADKYAELLEGSQKISDEEMDDIHYLMASFTCGGMRMEKREKREKQ